MHDSPAQGVVNRDCRVHGLDNLYVGSSAVFPTSSHSNPTLTLLALSLRLADHVRQRLETESPGV
jgi:choline dehydrogenase-like flavoprotein